MPPAVVAAITVVSTVAQIAVQSANQPRLPKAPVIPEPPPVPTAADEEVEVRRRQVVVGSARTRRRSGTILTKSLDPAKPTVGRATVLG